jgi:hypothetical protein
MSMQNSPYGHEVDVAVRETKPAGFSRHEVSSYRGKEIVLSKGSNMENVAPPVVVVQQQQVVKQIGEQT